MKAFTIVLVEDSERYIEELTALIIGALSVKQENIEIVRTEVDFYARIPHWEQSKPDVFVVDMMIPYKDLDQSDAHVAPEIRRSATQDRFYRAGIRCINSLLANDKVSKIPIVIHSILGEAEIASDAQYPIPTAQNLTICKKEANSHGVVEALKKILDKLPPA